MEKHLKSYIVNPGPYTILMILEPLLVLISLM